MTNASWQYYKHEYAAYQNGLCSRNVMDFPCSKLTVRVKTPDTICASRFFSNHGDKCSVGNNQIKVNALSCWLLSAYHGMACIQWSDWFFHFFTWQFESLHCNRCGASRFFSNHDDEVRCCKQSRRGVETSLTKSCWILQGPCRTKGAGCISSRFFSNHDAERKEWNYKGTAICSIQEREHSSKIKRRM